MICKKIFKDKQMIRPTISIEELTIAKHVINNVFLKVRVLNKSDKLKSKYSGSKFEYFFLDFMDENSQLRALFYIGAKKWIQ